MLGQIFQSLKAFGGFSLELLLADDVLFFFIQKQNNKLYHSTEKNGELRFCVFDLKIVYLWKTFAIFANTQMTQLEKCSFDSLQNVHQLLPLSSRTNKRISQVTVHTLIYH